MTEKRQITKVHIFNRDEDCCGIKDRANGIEVRVGTYICGTLVGGEDEYVIECDDLPSASSIQIIGSDDYMHFAEVEIYGLKGISFLF